MKRILLALRQPKNRQVLAEYLGEHYKVLITESEFQDCQFDLAMLDSVTLERNWQAIQKRKEAENPVFLPFIFICRRQDVRAIHQDLWPCIDDLIFTPIEKVELRARVEMLLRTRTLAEQLDDSHGDLELRVRKRTTELKRKSSELEKLNKELLAYQKQLCILNSELVLSEERERRKFAEDLHDSIAQLLVLSKFNLDEARAELPSGSWQIALEEVCQYLDQAMEQTRSLMFELSPPELYTMGLQAGLGGLAERIERAHNLQIDFSADEIPADELNDDSTILLYRSVKELLVNIVKHAEVSRAKLSLFKEDNIIRVQVEDGGIGCDVSSIGDHSKVKKSGGFGLLSIKERLRHMGGQFDISSHPGKGTVITLTLPLPKEASVSAAEHVTPIRVVIADDHQMFREGLRSLLESQNFEIVGEAKDGEEAIRIAHETNPDAVVMDIEMPLMDGIEATRRIVAELPAIKVIGLSMNRDKFRISQALESGASGFVLKGSAFDELHRAIQTVLHEKTIFLSAGIRDMLSDT
jgi:signal transduction histidine kinase/ActR/RegA family two-component response regulator